MGIHTIQAHYSALLDNAALFANYADSTTGLAFRLEQIVNQLRAGGWCGKGAEAFLAEMDADVFPALWRLSEALETANRETQNIHQLLKTHEEYAASLFIGGADIDPANTPHLEKAEDDSAPLAKAFVPIDANFNEKVAGQFNTLKRATQRTGIVGITWLLQLLDKLIKAIEALALWLTLSARYDVPIPFLPLPLLRLLKELSDGEDVSLSDLDRNGRMADLLKLIAYYDMASDPENAARYLKSILDPQNRFLNLHEQWIIPNPFFGVYLKHAVRKAAHQLEIYHRILREAGFTDEQLADVTSLNLARTLVGLIEPDHLQEILDWLGDNFLKHDLGFLLQDMLYQQAALDLLGTPTTDEEWAEYYAHLLRLQGGYLDDMRALIEQINARRIELFLKLVEAGYFYDPLTGKVLNATLEPILDNGTAIPPTSLFELMRAWNSLTPEQQALAQARYDQMRHLNTLANLLEGIGEATLIIGSIVSLPIDLVVTIHDVLQSLNEGNVGNALLISGLFLFPVGGDFLPLLRRYADEGADAARRLLETLSRHGIDDAITMNYALRRGGLTAEDMLQLDSAFTALRGKLAAGVDTAALNAYLRNLPSDDLAKLLGTPDFLKNLPPNSSLETLDFYRRTWDYNGQRQLHRPEAFNDDAQRTVRDKWKREQGLDTDEALDAFIRENQGTFDQAVLIEARNRANGKNASELYAAVADARTQNPDAWDWRFPAKGEHMHHIVPALDRDFDVVRRIIDHYGIHPNSAFNGVGLRADVHHRIHRDTYSDALQEALSNTSTSEQAASVLEQVARRLDQININYAGQTLTDAQIDQIVADAIRDIGNIRP